MTMKDAMRRAMLTPALNAYGTAGHISLDWWAKTWGVPLDEAQLIYDELLEDQNAVETLRKRDEAEGD